MIAEAPGSATTLTVGRRNLLVDRPWLVEPLLIFGITRALLFAVAYAAQTWLPFHTGSDRGPFPNSYLLDGWFRWDAGWYLSVAAHGYTFDPVTHGGSIAFFPLYPLLIRLVGWLIGSPELASLVIANVAFAAALVVIARLVEWRVDRRTARWTLLLMCAFPYAFFFAAAYTESLFLLLVALSFYLAEREQWWLSGAAGFLGALTRSIGGALGPAIFLLYLHRRRYNPRQIRGSFLASALPPLGSGVFMSYLYLRFGDPLAFAKASLIAWGRYDVFRDGFARFDPSSWTLGNYDLILFANFVVAILWLVLTIPTFRTLGPGYAFFQLVAVVIPLASQTESLGRFVSVLFPGFIVLAYGLKDSLTGKLVLIGSSLLLGVLTALFVNWYWIV